MTISLGELATQFGSELVGDPSRTVSRVASLRDASADAISFLSNPSLRDELKSTAAGAVIVTKRDAESCRSDVLIASDPYLLYARVARVLHPEPGFEPGINKLAFVDSSASVAASAFVAANAAVGEGSTIGENVYIGPGSVVGPRCSVGDSTRLIANVTLVQDTNIGERCVVHPGVVIASQGFGNAMSDDGWVSIPQIGGVKIGNDVEIGSNTTIDRGAIGDTVIENGVRLDNLIQIAHNVRIGEHTAMAAQTGISGSTTIGKRCMFAGRSGTFGHVTVCDGAVIGAAAVVSKNVTEPGLYSGFLPAEPDRSWKRNAARFRRLDGIVRRISALEKK